MTDNLVVYRPKERLIILSEHELDYEVQDIDTGAMYMIDKSYFRKKYVAEGTVKDQD